MSNRFNKEDFLKMRERQAALFNREQTPMDFKVTDVMYGAGTKAMDNVSSGRTDVCMQAVSLSTGLGKSTSAYAFIASAYQRDPKFSAAYVVPTVKMAMEAQEGLEQLMGVGSTALWSSYHKNKGVDRGRAVTELGFIPSRTLNKGELQTSRVVIVTHTQLIRELKLRIDEGTMKYLGRPRSIVFLDEHPDLVEVVGCTAEQIQSFHDRLAKESVAHSWLPVFSSMVARMSEIVRSEGGQYLHVELLSSNEGEVFETSEEVSLWDLTDVLRSDEVRHRDVEAMSRVVDFCKAASKGNAFYSRKDFSFFAYQLHFPSTYSGFVLLDATSDLSGLIPLHPMVNMVEVPEVNYENLELMHVDLPRKFSRMSTVIRTKVLGQDYGKYIVSTVMENTSPGDDVLVVVHKDVLTQELIGSSENPLKPLSWNGRQVNTQNWGAGVGLNKFKDKTHVFLFGDFYLPRATTIGWTHGWSEQPLSNNDLKLAVGIRTIGDRYSPRGQYAKCHDGHLLRWTKQLSMRGAARQVDKYGKCFPMKLFTTMNLALLVPNLQRLFPHVLPPRPANQTIDNLKVSLSGRKALVNLLCGSITRSSFGADEIESATNIQQKRLTSEFNAVSEIVIPLGWSLKGAPELGRSGRMKYLVNEARIGRESIESVTKAH